MLFRRSVARSDITDCWRHFPLATSPPVYRIRPSQPSAARASISRPAETLPARLRIAAERSDAALLPVLDLVDGEAEGGCEVVLRQAGAGADGTRAGSAVGFHVYGQQ